MPMMKIPITNRFTYWERVLDVLWQGAMPGTIARNRNAAMEHAGHAPVGKFICDGCSIDLVQNFRFAALH